MIDMDMPDNCFDCGIQYDCISCGITGTSFYENELQNGFDAERDRLPDCPIKFVVRVDDVEEVENEGFMYYRRK